MVPILILVALAAQLALPPGIQPRKSLAMAFPKRVVLGPRQVFFEQRPVDSGKCSIPLLNALKDKDVNVDPRMPAPRPQTTGNIRIVEPPAPPCPD